VKALAASLALAWLAACASTPQPDVAAPAAKTAPAATATASLAGTRWTGIVPGASDPRTLPRLEFTESRVAGFTGCNMLSGTWRMENGEPHVGPLATTKRMCLGPEGDVEKRVLAALSSQSRITRAGNRLVFTAPDGARFEFEESAAS
jgi:heat shock protein HslJ